VTSRTRPKTGQLRRGRRLAAGDTSCTPARLNSVANRRFAIKADALVWRIGLPVDVMAELAEKNREHAELRDEMVRLCVAERDRVLEQRLRIRRANDVRSYSGVPTQVTERASASRTVVVRKRARLVAVALCRYPVYQGRASRSAERSR
jgi:hypothetical protein